MRSNMKNLSFQIKYHLVKLGICIVLAILVFVFRNALVENLKYFIGALMVSYGVEEIVYETLNYKLDVIHKSKAYLGLVEIILGSVLLIGHFPFETICIIWATWSIMREAYEIREIITEIKSITMTVISGIESIVTIVLSIMLIFEPTEHHAMIHMYLLLVELVLTPLVPLVDELIESQKRKRKAQIKEWPIGHSFKWYFIL